MKLVVLFVVLVCGTVFGQDNTELAGMLEKALKGKIFILRGLPKQDKLVYDSTLKLKHSVSPTTWQHSQMLIDSVDSRSDSIVIVGRRTNAGDETQGFEAGKKIEIQVEGPLAGTSKENAAAIFKAVFVLNTTELAALVPVPWYALFNGSVFKAQDGEYLYVPRLSPELQALKDPALVTKLTSGDLVYRPWSGIEPPKATYQPNPEYTEEARKARAQGVVVLAVVVGKNGRPVLIFIEKPFGYGMDDKAYEAIRSWKFDPATKDGVPVASAVSVEVSFALH